MFIVSRTSFPNRGSVGAKQLSGATNIALLRSLLIDKR